MLILLLLLFLLFLLNLLPQVSLGISPEQQEETEMKIEILNDKINGLVAQAEEFGNKGEMEEAQGVLKLSDQLKDEREELKESIKVHSVSWNCL